jgi:hypothetical protein
MGIKWNKEKNEMQRKQKDVIESPAQRRSEEGHCCCDISQVSRGKKLVVFVTVE